MPHLTLEYSANITEQIDFQDLFRHFHKVLNETGGVNLGNCKSRAVVQNEHLIGDGDAGHAFVHLNVLLLAGRSQELKQKLTHELLDVLKRFFTESLEKFDVQITVDMRDIDADIYAKHPSGTLTPQ